MKRGREGTNIQNPLNKHDFNIDVSNQITMKYLLLTLLITLSFVTLSQSDAVIVISLQEEVIEDFQIKYTDDTDYQKITERNNNHEYASVCIFCDMAEVYTNSEYSYDILINGHYLTLKADLVDDILTNPEELTVECACQWDVVENVLVLSY